MDETSEPGYPPERRPSFTPGPGYRPRRDPGYPPGRDPGYPPERRPSFTPGPDYQPPRDQDYRRPPQPGYPYQSSRARFPAPGPGESAGERTGGAEGNERLTTWTGVLLLILLAAEGVTILSVHRLITAHFFLGMLLLGPVAVKLASVCYRFFRYYAGSVPYRRKGPPAPLLRLIGPLIVASTVGVFGSGVALAITGPGPGDHLWLFLHKGCFVVWFCVMTVHVLAYLPRLPMLLTADHTRAVLAGRGMRLSLLAASLIGGLIIAALTVHLAGPWRFPG